MRIEWEESAEAMNKSIGKEKISLVIIGIFILGGVVAVLDAYREAETIERVLVSLADENEEIYFV